MSYQVEFSFTFRNLPGLTLNAKLFDNAGSQTGGTITSGFVNLGDGAYQYLATIPDGHVGTLKVYDSATPSRCLALTVNPQETENADAKTSTRSTFAGGAVDSVTNPVTVGTNNDKTGYALSGAAVQAIWDALTSALITVGSVGKLIKDNLDAAVSSRLASAGYTTPPTVTAIRTEMDNNSTKLANLDAAVSTRLPTSSYSAPPSAASIRSEIDSNSTQLAKLGAPAGASLSADIAAIKNDTGTVGVVISTATMRAIADELLKRSVSNVEGSASTHSLAEVILAMFESAAPSTTWTIYRTDHTTVFNTRTLTTDADALPVVEVN